MSAASQTLCPSAGHALADALERSLGVTVDSVGVRQWQRALEQRARARSLAPSDYALQAAADSAELVRLLEALCIDESWLNRDAVQLAAIAQWLRQRPPGGPLRVLCAPCARGEEAWTLAALLHELGYRAPHCRIIAVDLAPAAITQARAARLPGGAWRSAEPLPWWLRHDSAGGLHVDPVLHGLVQFVCANLCEWQPPAGTRFDLVCSRNFLIYLGAEARQRWLARVAGWLAPAGTLWTARSEHLDAGTVGFQAFGSEAAWIRQVVPPAPGPAASSRPVIPFQPKSGPATAAPSPRATRAAVALPLPGPAPTHASPLAQALAALQADALLDAEALLRQALFLERDCEEALLHLAALRLRQGDVAEAQRLQARLRRLTRMAGARA